MKLKKVLSALTAAALAAMAIAITPVTAGAVTSSESLDSIVVTAENGSWWGGYYTLANDVVDVCDDLSNATSLEITVTDVSSGYTGGNISSPVLQYKTNTWDDSTGDYTTESINLTVGSATTVNLTSLDINTDSSSMFLGLCFSSSYWSSNDDCGYGTAQFDVVVYYDATVLVESIEVTLGSTHLVVGGTTTATATASPSNATDDTVTWSSSDESVATVNSDGEVTAVAVGTATITATAYDGSGVTGSADVTVVEDEVPATAIEVTPTEVELEVGGTSTLSATLTPSDTTDSATYTSSDESVATVSSTGVVTAVAEGTATITVSANDDVSATVAVTVTVAENPVTAITVSSNSVSVLVGETATVTATVTPADADDTTVTWASSDETVATVADGVITGVAAGTATVTASSANGLTATVAVTVTEKTTTTTTTHTHVYDSGVRKGMYYVYTCAICGDTYEVYYAIDSQWAATFWGLVGQYGTTSTRTTSASTSSEEVIEDTEVEETAAEATSSDSAYTKTMTIDATGSYWDQVALTLEELLGDIDPATVKSITISGSDTFCIGYNNADGWVQTDDDTEFELSDISFEDDVYYVAFVGRIVSGTTTITWTINT